MPIISIATGAVFMAFSVIQLPISARINLGLILDNWDDILRFIATIKLRETPASQLFRRLSSYSRQHPLYAALKEYGKIIKTLFLLKYIDNLEMIAESGIKW